MNSVEKTIRVLNCLSDAEKSLGVTEISSRLLFPKSTVHRILSNLLKYSLVTRDKENSKYRLGIQVIRYANSFYNSFDLRRYSKEILKKTCFKTHLTTFLSIWQDDRGICIDSFASSQKTHAHHLFVEVGKIMPFHCAASAKILLAYQSYDEITRIIKQNGLHKYTSKTIIDPEKLINHLEIIRNQGYAVCDEELEEGIRAISAPIKDFNNQVIASITITGLINRLPVNRDDYFVKILLDTANSISSKIGYKNNFI